MMQVSKKISKTIKRYFIQQRDIVEFETLKIGHIQQGRRASGLVIFLNEMNSPFFTF
jgi:hypothetical protein